MINSETLKSFKPDSNTFCIISNIQQTSECNQECVKFTVTQANGNVENAIDNQAIERTLSISSNLDIDENGLYITKLTGYDAPKQNDYIRSNLTSDTVEYSTENNSLEPNSGVTVQNIDFSSLTGIYVRLIDYGKKLLCGNILENIILDIKKEQNNVLLIIDFNEVEEVSRNFLQTYTKFLLETSNKVIPINMSIDISNAFDMFILTNILEEQE